MPSRHSEASVRLFRGQEFTRLRAQCLASKTLFEDKEFPADQTSIGIEKEVEWKRPSEIVADPQFMVDGNRFSAVQGELGDCWLVSALSALTLNPGLLRRVVPPDQHLQHHYAGIFHFRIWQGGEWVDVVVDDRLPVTLGSRLCFTSSRNNSEFWSALLEKAYAKLHGSYASLNAGKSYEATEDLTGGVTERFSLHPDPPPDLFTIIAKGRQRGSLITCSISGQACQLDSGLVSGHAYCLTGARQVKLNTPWKPHVDLVRLRNPWGDDLEWHGAFGDDSSEWQLVPEEERRRLQLTVDADGEFWMTFKQFSESFSEVFVTSLNPQTVNAEAKTQLYSLLDVVKEAGLHQDQVRSAEAKTSRTWEVAEHDGSWVRNASAGGPLGDVRQFSTNPQFVVVLGAADDDDNDNGCDDDDNNNVGRRCSVVVSLSQKKRRVNRLPVLSIGFYVYRIDDDEDPPPRPLNTSWLRLHRPTFSPPAFRGTRTVTHRLSLLPGTYVIVPCTHAPGQDAEFLLRIFTEKVASLEENDVDFMILDPVNTSTEGPSDDVDGEAMSGLRDKFVASAGGDMEITATQLKTLLDSIFPDMAISLDLSRSLLAMMDRDLSGKVSYHEFESLVQSLRRWVAVYHARADDGLLSGRSWGLGEALHQLGFQVPRRLQALVVVRYGDHQGNIALTDFVMAACRISVMLERFEARCVMDGSHAVMRKKHWLQDTLYC